MKVMITGARGNFPTALIPKLLRDDHKLVLYDIEPMTELEGCVDVQGDVRDAAALTHAMAGCDAVVHAAALGRTHMDHRNSDDYFKVNVEGTHNVLRAMALNGVRFLVFSSSASVVGDGARVVRTVDEHTPCRPATVYAYTKWLCEEMCRYHAEHEGLYIAILRYGRFEPVDRLTAGIGLLSDWVDREDVVQANMLALGAVTAENFRCRTFHIHAETPFSSGDWPALELEPDHVVEGYWPGALDILAEHGIAVPTIHTRYSIERARDELGYAPDHNFEGFLNRLRHGR